MAAQRGRDVLLQTDAGGGSPATDYTTIAGLRVTTWTMNGEDVDVTTKDDNGWQQRLSGAGVRNLTISVSGIFQDSAIEETVRGWAFDQTINFYRIILQNGDTLEFQAQISSYERGGDHDNAETYSFSLNSHATPLYTAA